MEFARAMAPMSALPAERLAQLLGAGGPPPWRVLDIAAGHGRYGIALARHNRGADNHALDLPNVLTVAAEHARAAGLGERFHLLPGSAFEVEFGSGYDVVISPRAGAELEPVCWVSSPPPAVRSTASS